MEAETLSSSGGSGSRRWYLGKGMVVNSGDSGSGR